MRSSRIFRNRRSIVEFLAIVGLVLLAIPVSVYILDHQRLRWPWEDVITLEAEFSNAQAVAPGQGQNVTVAGVEVGEITKVETEDGLAVVTVQLDPDEVGPIYRNATMYLRPKTGLNDMTIQLDPGRPEAGTEDGGRLGDGDRIGVAQTTAAVNSDEVLSHLDADTRRYLAVFANAAGQGLKGRGPDLREAARGDPADARAVGARQPCDRRPAREAAPPDPQPARAVVGGCREGQRAGEPGGRQLGRARDRRRRTRRTWPRASSGCRPPSRPRGARCTRGARSPRSSARRRWSCGRSSAS